MSNEVYANNNEIACKAAAGKSICAFPDVCMTPPENPATPPGVPIPYPNTGFASDTTEGSNDVSISGKEIILKNKSYFKKSAGDEAGCAAKKGVITSTNQGKVYFISWSMNVKIEGENAVRHLDMTTHNHASPLANEAAPMVYNDASAFANNEACATDKKAMEDACVNEDPCPGVLKSKVGEQRQQVSSATPDQAFARHAALMADGVSPTAKVAAAATAEAEGSDCVKKSRCYLRPYAPHANQSGCCPGQTGHHVPPWSTVKNVPGHSHGRALCVCLEGASQHLGSHGKNHAAIDYLAKMKGIEHEQQCNLKEYNKLCAETVEAQCGCNKDCIAAQLDQNFGDSENKTATHKDMNSSAPLSNADKATICKSAGVPVNPTSGPR